MTETTREPVFGNVPALVMVLCGTILVVSIIALLGPPALSNWVMGVSAVQMGQVQLQQPLGPLPPYVLHVFVHGGWLHLGMNTLGLLAFGSPVARWLGTGQARGIMMFLLVFFLSAIAGALVEGVVLALNDAPGALLVGASGGLMGLIGVLVRLNYGQVSHPLPLFSHTVIMAMLPWIGLNILIAFFGAPGVSAAVAWSAHLGGLFAGALLVGLIAPRR